MTQELETILGTLADAQQFIPGTWQTAFQLLKEVDEDVRKENFFVNDAVAYKGEMAYFNSAEVVFPALEDAFSSRLSTDDAECTISDMDVERVAEANGTVSVNLSKINLQKLNGFISYLEINTSNYDHLFDGNHKDERKLAGVPFGQDYEDFSANMKRFHDEGKGVVTVYVLNPELVKPISRFGGISLPCALERGRTFDAYRSVEKDTKRCMRGALVDPPKRDPSVQAAYETILTNPNAIDSMTPAIARGLSRLIEKYKA